MSKSIAVFGAGPGLGQAVARRYAGEGYAVTLVGRRQEPLDLLAKELTSAGATAHVITADLSDSGATPRLAEEFLPHMLEQGDGAILTAQGGSTVQGLPNLSGPGPAQAAQRNYLQSLHAEVADKGVYVGMLYIGAIIENSAFHTQTEEAKNGGASRYWGPTVNPAHLAGLLWNMHSTRSPAETIYP